MCLVIFAHQAHPEYPLVVAANRDEYHARPTSASHFWTSHPDLLAGRDEEQGGTWMGITRGGRFAAITNYRDPSRTAPAPRSRGELPLDFLVGSSSPRNFLQALGERAQDYAGFNLLVGDGRELWCFSNSDGNPPSALAPGLYGLSNAHLDTPWPKSELGKRRLADVLRAAGESGRLDHEALAMTVADRRTFDPAELRPLGLDGEMEQLLSSQFIVSPGYGTRSRTTLWSSREGIAHWREQSFGEDGEIQREQALEFALATGAPPGR